MNDIAMVISNDNKGITVKESIELLSKTGFKKYFIQWYDKDWDFSQLDQHKYAKEKGLNPIFAHLGYQKINELWCESEIGNAMVNRYKKDLDDVHELGIDLVVMHLTSKSEAPGPNEIGLKRLQEIADYANSLNMRIAFENTKIKGYLEYVITNINRDNVGVCLDIGHSHAHFNDDFNFELFKDKIFAIHVHDNDGTSDQHLIPGDGNIDWNYYIEGLKKANYKASVSIESCYRDIYTDPEDFYKKCYQKAIEIANQL